MHCENTIKDENGGEMVKMSKLISQTECYSIVDDIFMFTQSVFQLFLSTMRNVFSCTALWKQSTSGSLLINSFIYLIKQKTYIQHTGFSFA